MTEAMRVLSLAMDVGEQMLICGGEISRVEDTIDRICRAYGATRVDAFTITSSIIVTMNLDQDLFTQTRRIRAQSTDLSRLEQLNALSRDLCARTPDIDEARSGLEAALRSVHYPPLVEFLAYAMTAGAFSIFFGGTAADALVSALVGAGLKAVLTACGKLRINRIFSSVVCALAGGAVAALAIRLGLGHSFDKIVIGDIMLLIPGLALTNAMRDLLVGDTMSGLLRLIDAVLVAIAIALGFALPGGLAL